MSREAIIQQFIAACDTAKHSPYWRQYIEGATDCAACHQFGEMAPIVQDAIQHKAMQHIGCVSLGAHVCAECIQIAIGKDLHIEDIQQVPLSVAYIVRHEAELARMIKGRAIEQQAVEQFADMVTAKQHTAPTQGAAIYA